MRVTEFPFGQGEVEILDDGVGTFGGLVVDLVELAGIRGISS